MNKFKKFDLVPTDEQRLGKVKVNGQYLLVFVVNPVLKSFVWKHYQETGEILKIKGVKVVERKK